MIQLTESYRSKLVFMSMKKSWVAFGSGVDRLLSLPEKVLVLLYRIRLGRVRANFSFDPLGIYSYKKIPYGDNVNLGYRPILIVSRSGS